MFGMGMGRMGLTRLGRGGGGDPWVPNRITGTTFSTTQLLPGLSGSYNPTDATRIFLSAPNSITNTGGSLWCAVIKGTSAVLRVPNTNSNYSSGALRVSVDGAAYTNLTGAAGGYFTLFSGLSDVEHYVVVKIGNAYGDASAYFLKSAADSLVVAGSNTYIDLPYSFAFSNTIGANHDSAAYGIANTANFLPALTKFSTIGSNIGAIVIRGNFHNLFASVNATADPVKFYVSTDGADPVMHDLSAVANTGGHVAKLPALPGGVHTYYIWACTRGAVSAVSGDSALVSAPQYKRQMHQFGDSITEGQAVSNRGEVDTLRVAAALGFAGLTSGVSGYTIQQIDTMLDTVLPQLTVDSADDVAIVAAGRNNVTTDADALDAVEIAAYESIISKLLAKGYSKVLCRGILPSGTRLNLWTAANASIQAIVTGLANPKVVFIDTSACPTYTSIANDKTHPDAAGYAVVAAFVKPLYQSALGL